MMSQKCCLENMPASVRQLLRQVLEEPELKLRGRQQPVLAVTQGPRQHGHPAATATGLSADPSALQSDLGVLSGWKTSRPAALALPESLQVPTAFNKSPF